MVVKDRPAGTNILSRATHLDTSTGGGAYDICGVNSLVTHLDMWVPGGSDRIVQLIEVGTHGTPGPVVKQLEVIGRDFQALADEWRRDTKFLSADDEIALHPAYQRIIGMGERAIPLILRSLQQNLDHWFWALTMIARESPVPTEEAGNQRLMRGRWLEWGRRKGHIT